MHIDMHYAGTYAICRLAGIKNDAAKTIATCAQFVDDSAESNLVIAPDEDKKDKSLITEVTTRHSGPIEVIKGSHIFLNDPADQLDIWVPFHFIPGGEGKSLTEKLQCRKNSQLSQAMLDHHIASNNLFQIGIAAHVYADTFAHYGFSGVSSRLNLIDQDSLENYEDDSSAEQNSIWGLCRDVKNTASKLVKRGKAAAAETAVTTPNGALGHAGVTTRPDKPYLSYSFKYTHEDRRTVIDASDYNRNNAETYLEYCENLYAKLGAWVRDSGKEYLDPDAHPELKPFAEFAEKVKEILKIEEPNASKRNKEWQNHANAISEQIEIHIEDYAGLEWLDDIADATNRKFSHRINQKQFFENDFVKFFEAAREHKSYVLETLLPSVGIKFHLRQYNFKN